jgi:hypothetical protein
MTGWRGANKKTIATAQQDHNFRGDSLLLALFGHALISELSLLSGAKRKLDLETPKGRYWREADIGVSAHVG